MSNENTPVVAGDTSVANFFSQQTDINDIPQRSNYIPYLAIAYPTSDVVSKGVAAPGDFVFDGKTSLGKSVEVIVADFRIHASVWDNDSGSTISDFYMHSSDPERGRSEAYKAFIEQKLVGDKKMHEGVDLLLWLPAVNSFAVIYLKSTTYDAFQGIYNSSRGGRVVKLLTRLEQSKKGRKFFLLDSFATNRAVAGSGLSVPGVDISCDVTIPIDFAVAAVKRFKEFVNTEIVSEGNDTSDR